MNTAYYQGNRERLYAMMQPGSLLMLFSGEEIRKTNDEYYPFFADRSFVYFTGLKCRQAVLLALKDAEGSVAERRICCRRTLLPSAGPAPGQAAGSGKRFRR